MSELIISNILNDKSKLLEYYRNRSHELIAESKQVFPDADYKRRASYLNKGIRQAKENLIKTLRQKSRSEGWRRKAILPAMLMITYTNYVVMLEARNEVWHYDYMAFTRRIGELWEPFCLLCWEYSFDNTLSYFAPPLFSDVKQKLTDEIRSLINSLEIDQRQKTELIRYYDKIWALVTSGNIKLKLDLHFQQGTSKFVVDFKSGFSSNEKGNTNRLLLVASAYRMLGEEYKCLMFVRSREDQNNRYLQTLKDSGLWEIYCGIETHEKIYEFTGFDLGNWQKENLTWDQDFDHRMYNYLKQHQLIQYLQW